MIWVDYCIIAVTLISLLAGILRGFTKEVLGIVTWVCALLVTWLFSDTAVSLLRIKISNPALSTAAGYAATFLLGLLIGAVISSLIVDAIRNSRFSSADRTLGAGFGLLRAALLTAVFVMVAANMGAREDKWWQESKIVPRLEWLANGLQMLVPPAWIEKLQPEPEPVAEPPKKTKPER